MWLKCKKFVFIVIALVSINMLFGCSSKEPTTRWCKLDMFHGRVIELDTGEPIEGTVAHVTYVVPFMYGGSPEMAVREALTDDNGEYLIPEEKAKFHTRFGCGFEGQLQIYKPGYGDMGKAKLTCPEEEKETSYSSHGKPVCIIKEGKYLIWGLPKLKTKEERSNNLPSLASEVPREQQILLMQTVNEERYYLGYELFDLPEGYPQMRNPPVQKETEETYEPKSLVKIEPAPPFSGPCKLKYEVRQDNGEWKLFLPRGSSLSYPIDDRPECINKQKEMDRLYYEHILKKK